MKKFFILFLLLVFSACTTDEITGDADISENDADLVLTDDTPDIDSLEEDNDITADEDNGTDEVLPNDADLTEPDRDAAADDDMADVDTAPDDEIQMNFYFGNFHSHSGISDGEGTPEEVMQWAKEEPNIDFYAMTDHSEQIFGNEWNEIKEMTDLYNEDGVFVAIRGFEWSHPLNGHICIYLTDDFNSAYSSLWIDEIYEWIDAKNAIAQFNHPGREVNVFNNLAFEIEVMDNMVAIETGNKGDGNNDGEFLPYYITALDNGWVVAPASNQDNHSLSINSHRSVYVGPDLSRESLYEAMSARRRYSSDDPDIKITFKLGKNWMGSFVNITEDLIKFTVKVEDNEPILKLQLITNGGNVVSEHIPPEGTNSATWNPEIMVSKNGYYFLKVISTDVLDNDGPEQIAVTAPVWVTKQ